MPGYAQSLPMLRPGCRRPCAARAPAVWASSDFLSGLVGLLANENSQTDETAEKLLATRHAVPKNLDAEETSTNHNPVDAREQRRLENGLSQNAVRFVLTSLLLVLFVNGLTRPTQFDFSLVRFCLGGPLWL